MLTVDVERSGCLGNSNNNVNNGAGAVQHMIVLIAIVSCVIIHMPIDK